MARRLGDEAAQTLLDYVADHGDRWVLLNSEPADYADAANAANQLAVIDVPVGAGNYTPNNGGYRALDKPSDHWRLLCEEARQVAVTQSGTPSWFAIIRTEPGNTELLYAAEVFALDQVSLPSLLDTETIDWAAFTLKVYI